MRFEGRGVLITGAASGIGLAAAQRFSREGSQVFLVDRNEAGLSRAARDPAVNAAGYATADVSVTADVRGAVAEATSRLATVDVLISSAGIYDIGALMELNEERWDRLLAVDLKGVFLMGQAFARIAQSGGAIVNVASIAGMTPSSNSPAAHYSSAKAGVIALTRQMALELAPRRIRVNAICPGMIDTPMLRPAKRTPETAAKVPLGRLGRPDEVAGLMAYLASDEAAYMTGEHVVMDGGLTLAR